MLTKCLLTLGREMLLNFANKVSIPVTESRLKDQLFCYASIDGWL